MNMREFEDMLYEEQMDRHLRSVGFTERGIDAAYIRNMDKAKKHKSIMESFKKVLGKLPSRKQRG